MMNKIREKAESTKTFFGDVAAEMRKSTWPERQELIGSTVVVIVSVVLLALYVGLSDKILISLLKLVVPTS